jgi:mono/diheme cytochrome c family protein
MMIAGGLALAAMTAGCASTASEKPAAPSTTVKAPAAPSAPSAPSAPAMSAAVVAAQAPGEATFSARCNGCHGSGRNGAPTVEVLATKQPSFIVEALTTGKMKGMGASLSDQDKANVAMFLTKKPV